MKRYLFLLQGILALLAACTDAPEIIEPDDTARVLLRIERTGSTTRTVDEYAVKDLNIYLYKDRTLVRHFYSDKMEHLLDVPRGNYDLFAVANMHADMGELSCDELLAYRTDAPVKSETLVMFGKKRTEITPLTKEVAIVLRRNAAKIVYDITTEAAGIELCSVQLCDLPNGDFLIADDRMDAADPACGFHDSEIHTLAARTTSARGTFYMLSNRRGTNMSIRMQTDKNPDNAPAHASYLLIRGRSGENRMVDYLVYLGQNNTSDFNVCPNDTHTYRIRIVGNAETDTRISSYLFECTAAEGRPYNSTADIGIFRYSVENTSNHTLSGRFRVVRGDGSKVTVTDRAYDRIVRVPYDFVPAASNELTVAYMPELVERGVNSTLSCSLSVEDETGEEIVYTFSYEFANKVEVFASTGTNIDMITVAGALEQETSSDRITAYCYEDGCTLAVKLGTGETFEGWYADAAYTQKLSGSTTFRYVPTQAGSTVYAKVKQPEANIVCRETNKNATYMFNTNQAELTFENYSGVIWIRATCTDGGVFASGASQIKTMLNGEPIVFDPIVFVPTKAGTVSYTLEAFTADGASIGSKTVTNTIAATELTPRIRIYYDGEKKQESSWSFGGDGYQYYSWFGYDRTAVDISFSPALDYPEPLAETTLLNLKLRPSLELARYTIHDAERELDEGETHYYLAPNGNEYWLVSEAYATFDFTSVGFERSFEVSYAAATQPATHCLMPISEIYDIGWVKQGVELDNDYPPLFGAYERHDNTGENRRFFQFFSELSSMVHYKVVDRYFAYFFLDKSITSREVELVPNDGIGLRFVTDPARIELINEVHQSHEMPTE